MKAEGQLCHRSQKNQLLKSELSTLASAKERVRERESIVVTTVVIRRDPNSNCFSKKPDSKGNKAQET